MTAKNGKSKLVTVGCLDEKFEEFEDRFKNDLYNIKDEIVTEIKAMREEFDVHQYSHIRINDDLHEHDDRLKKLENQTAN